MKELEAKSLFSRIVFGLGIGCVALSIHACSGDDMPAPAPGNTNQPSGENDDENTGDPCGGIAGFTCPSGKFCDFEEGTCGVGDMFGKCRTIPASCEQDCTTKVCGCDGLKYCNACLAHFAGVDETLDTTTCEGIPPPPPTNN